MSTVVDFLIDSGVDPFEAPFAARRLQAWLRKRILDTEPEKNGIISMKEREAILDFLSINDPQFETFLKIAKRLQISRAQVYRKVFKEDI